MLWALESPFFPLNLLCKGKLHSLMKQWKINCMMTMQMNAYIQNLWHDYITESSFSPKHFEIYIKKSILVAMVHKFLF